MTLQNVWKHKELYFIANVCLFFVYSVTQLSVLWSGSAGKTPLIEFRASTILGLDSPIDRPYSG